MKVGFIGLGDMGMPMSKHLLNAGFQLTVHNRSRGKVADITSLGAAPAWSAAEVTQASDVVLTCLPDVPTVEQVFLGEDGIVSEAKPGQVLVDHSTVGPATSRRIAAAAEAKGAWFLDAPVSGLVKGATEATLTIMVGGERSAFDIVLPVFRAIGSNIYHVGGPGAGSAIKLMNQMLWSINTLGAAEVSLLCAKLGADPDLALQIFGNSSGQSAALTRSGERMLNQNYSEDVLPLRLVLKDISLANEMAVEAGANLTAVQDALEVFQRAADEGLEELDASSIFSMLRGQVGHDQSSTAVDS